MFSSNKLKFLSDENFPRAINKLLSQEGHDLKESPLGFTDRQLSKLAKSESRIILTFDKHFLNKRLFPPEEHSGIVVFKITSPLNDTTLSLWIILLIRVVVFRIIQIENSGQNVSQLPEFSILTKLLKQVKASEFKGRLFIISPFRFLSYPDNLFK